MEHLQNAVANLRRDGEINTAELLESSIAVISAGGENGDHQLEVGVDEWANSLDVSVSSIIREVQYLGIYHLLSQEGHISKLKEHTGKSSHLHTKNWCNSLHHFNKAKCLGTVSFGGHNYPVIEGHLICHHTFNTQHT